MDLKNLPDISFAQKDIETILNSMIIEYEQAYYQQTGQQMTLYPGDKIRIFLYSQALREFQLRQLIDYAAKQNLIKYSTGNNLVHLGAFYNLEKLEATKATVTMRFNLSEPQQVNQVIKSGTRVSSTNNVFFQTLNDIDVQPGVQYVESLFECTVDGSIGNNFTPGQINILVDPLPWISSVVNIDKSQGGSDIEDEESFRQRIHEAPEGFSTAGPEGAYKFFAKRYSSAVKDIAVSSPSPGVVEIIVLLQNGEIPSQTFLDGISTFLNDRTIRPLTDKVEVKAPSTVNYYISLTYYISSDDLSTIESIQNKVNVAIQNFILWQKSKIGRDINPSILISYIISAGASRVDVTSPVFTSLQSNQVASIDTINVSYGGSIDG